MIDYYKDGSKEYEIPYVNGIQHGTASMYYEDGSKWYEALWVNGKRHGTLISYYKDGSKESEIPYVNGKAHGVEINSGMGVHGPKNTKKMNLLLGQKMA